MNTDTTQMRKSPEPRFRFPSLLISCSSVFICGFPLRFSVVLRTNPQLSSRSGSRIGSRREARRSPRGLSGHRCDNHLGDGPKYLPPEKSVSSLKVMDETGVRTS